MNTFGRMVRVSIFGESHGECVGVLLDGLPGGLPLAAEDFRADAARRRGGGPGATPRVEEDLPSLRSGVIDGHTTGAPLLMELPNRNVESRAYERFRHVPRPGHADFTAGVKYGGWNDLRGSGHFSGRLTAGLVAAGVVAKKLIAPTTASARVVSAGGSTDVVGAAAAAQAAGDSIGGLLECVVTKVPAGLGEPFFDGVESCLAHLLFAIPAVKGVEFGAGFALAGMRGSQANDRFIAVDGTTATNHAGGAWGGLTGGADLVFRVAIKPASSIALPQETVDLSTGEMTTLAVSGRHDACIALRVPVILEAAAALVLADFLALAGKLSMKYEV